MDPIMVFNLLSAPHRHIEYLDYVNLCVYVVFSFFTLKSERLSNTKTLEVEVKKSPYSSNHHVGN